MSNTKSPTLEALVVRRTFKAPRARVFAAFTQPEIASQWMCPGEMTAPDVQLDVRVGGRYRITMQQPDGERLSVGGVYQEVRPPERLAYTWLWEDSIEPAETLVTVDFLERDGGTEVVLKHERFTIDESRSNHEHGWNATFAN